MPDSAGVTNKTLQKLQNYFFVRKKLVLNNPKRSFSPTKALILILNKTNYRIALVMLTYIQRERGGGICFYKDKTSIELNAQLLLGLLRFFFLSRVRPKTTTKYRLSQLRPSSDSLVVSLALLFSENRKDNLNNMVLMEKIKSLKLFQAEYGRDQVFFLPDCKPGFDSGVSCNDPGDVAGSLYKQLTKAVDPDPNGSALIFFPGSESGSKREKLKITT